MKRKKLWVPVLLLVMVVAVVLSGCQAQTFQVSFVGEGVTAETQTVEEGKSAARPEDPVREGYRFEGWYLGETAYTFTEAVTGDIELTAQWTYLGYTGAGTSERPMVITEAAGFLALSERAAAGEKVYAELSKDLTLPEGFTPIGSAEHPFSGRFDGKGFTVSGLSGVSGLFGSTENAEILNLTVTGSAEFAGGAAGGVIAEAKAGTLVRFVKSDVTVSGAIAGGLIGQTSGQVAVEFCEASGEVTATDKAGGLIGSLGDDGFLLESVATGAVSGGTAGGLVGEKLGGSVVFDSYAHGNVAGSVDAGPVVGTVKTDALNPWNFIINNFYNGSAVLEGISNLYGQAAWDISIDIRWTEGIWTFEKGYPELSKETVLPEKVTITVLGGPAPETAQDGSFQLSFGQTLASAGQQANFAGWFLYATYLEGFPADMPVIKDLSLYATEANPALLERVWVSSNGTLDLTESGGYTRIRNQYVNDSTYLNESVYLFERNGVTYRAAILEEEGTLSWKTLIDGSWDDEKTYMADFSRFLGSWTYTTLDGEGQPAYLDLIVNGSYDEEGFLYINWQDSDWQGNTKVTADGEVRLYLGWYTEFFFNEDNVLSYDYGSWVVTYEVSEHLAEGGWLSMGGRVIMVDAESGTVELDGVSAPYEPVAGEQGGVLAFTVNGTDYALQSFGETVRCSSASGRTDFYPYPYQNFIGTWMTGDLADTYVIDEELTISLNGGEPAVMRPSIYNNALMYSFSLNNTAYTMTFEFGSMLDIRKSSDTQPSYLFNTEVLAYFQGEYTDLVTEYVINENYQITRTSLQEETSATAQGSFAFVDMGDGTGVITYLYQMDGTNYMMMFQTVEPIKLLFVADVNAAENYYFCYDKTQVAEILDGFQMEGDTWITGGKNSSTVSVSDEGLVTVDGTTYDARLSYDEIYYVPSLVLSGDPYGGDHTYQLTSYLGTLYMLDLTTLVWPDPSIGEQGNTDYHYYIPASKVERFVGTFVYQTDDGPEYVVYREDGTCLISTQITDEEGNMTVELVEYENIYFFTSLNLIDPSQSLVYLAFDAGTYIEDYEGWFIYVVMTENPNYVSITAIDYVRSEVDPYVGLLRGEDYSKLEINGKGNFVINGTESSAPVYTVNEDLTVSASFTLGGAEYTALMSHDESANAWTVALTTGGATTLYTLFDIPMAEVVGTYEADGETFVFSLKEQGAKSTLTVTVDGISAMSIEYQFNENGELVYCFSVGLMNYEVVFTKTDSGYTIAVEKSGLLPPPPPPPLL